MTDYIISTINSLSLKIIPILIIIANLFSIFTSFSGRMVIDEQSISVRVISKNVTRKQMFMYNIIVSGIFILISAIYLYSIW
jgi:hypothetical protein